MTIEIVSRNQGQGTLVHGNGEKNLVTEFEMYVPENSTVWVDWSLEASVPNGALGGFPGWGYDITFQPEGGLEFLLASRGYNRENRIWNVPDFASGSLFVDNPHRYSGNSLWTFRLKWTGYDYEDRSIYLSRGVLRAEAFREVNNNV